MEDMSVIEMFLEEVGLEAGQKDEIVSIIKGMGELLTRLHLCISLHVSSAVKLTWAQSSSKGLFVFIMHVCILL